MLGDSSQIIGQSQYDGNYGKGIYIYHVNDLGITYPNGINIQPQDEECSDGLWYWSNKGNAQRYAWDAGYCYNASTWAYYLRDSVSYSNDEGWSYSPADGRSHYFPIWAGVGEINSDACQMGTDRLFTNSTEIYPNEEVLGDRYDAWNVGYNEIFSPYSSPSTKNWDNGNSGIFIYHYSYSGSGPSGMAYFKIYKTGVGEPISLDSALHLTPPSRPMGLKVLPCDSLPESGGYKKIKIRWLQNQEPDMKRVVSGDTVKRYKIYRSTSADLSSPPPDALAYSENQYEYVSTRDFPVSASPEFTDTINSICTVPPVYGDPWYAYAVRYRVQAVDKYNDVSVLSDFANTQAWNTSSAGGEEEDNLISVQNSSSIPEEFSLKQNYPNPFNPTTNIQYDLPLDNFVSIKIFDITGREITTLVNEFKTAGRYSAGFNGADLSSGIYYYKIEAGNFSQVRKMLLLK
ncbi:MAG TPA: T9SS type A sorting domain-containing protein [Ignavibacteria bacterium]|nr:T9SS type A sorting domain-containing protein [Ignavibacteria bacterium]